MLDVRRIARSGVIEADGFLECPALGLRIRASDPDAAGFGLCSDEVFLRVAGRSWRVPPWFTTRSRRLPAGVLPAAVMCLRHFATGMGLIGAVLATALVVGVCAGSLAAIALALAGFALIGSVLVHELGHVVAYRILIGRTAPAVLTVRGASCRVIRLAGRPSSDAWVVLAGPLAPLVVALSSWPLFALAPSAVLLVTLIAIGHVVGLVLPVGDGVTLRAIARGR